MRRIGSSLLLALLVSFSIGARAEKKQRADEPYAVIGGTIFRESGHSLPGVEVMIAPQPQPGQTPVKIAYPKAVSDNRGEFAFRVPTSPMHYLITAKLKGFEPQQKGVDIEGEMRTDVTLILPAVSK